MFKNRVIGKVSKIPRFEKGNLLKSLRDEADDFGVGLQTYGKDFWINNLFKTDRYLPDVWIGCRYAFPHTDIYKECYFLTLTVHGKQFRFEDKNMNSDIDIPVGTFFTVDPEVQHWLFEKNWSYRKFWIGLQWEIQKYEWEEEVAKITENIVGFENHDIIRTF
jgi:hypothetical protein